MYFVGSSASERDSNFSYQSIGYHGKRKIWYYQKNKDLQLQQLYPDIHLEQISHIVYDKLMNISVWLSNEGRAYFVQNNSSLSQERRSSISQSDGSPVAASTTSSIPPIMPTFGKKVHWTGVCFHGSMHSQPEPMKGKGKGRYSDHVHKATTVAINAKFSLIAIGTNRGIVYVYSAHSYQTTPTLSHTLQLTSWSSQSSSLSSEDNNIESMQWTSDGYAISVGFKKRGLAVWSVYGGLLCASSEMDDVFGGEK